MVPDLPSLGSLIAKDSGVLTAIYEDLARPGVRQVGRALETVLQTGNILLLPLRMLNRYAAEFEKRNFEEIADRFKEISDHDIVDVRPEIGTPILENLSRTRDPDLRALFIELLASAADKKRVELAHPSFVRVIESLSPDEAMLLRSWKNEMTIPCVSVQRISKDGGQQTVRNVALLPPAGLNEPSMLPVYISNLEGLGILSQQMDRWLSEKSKYDPLIDDLKKEFPSIREGGVTAGLFNKDDGPQEGDITYELGVINIQPYGKVFQRACIDN